MLNQLWASKLGSASCPGPPTIFTVLNCTVNLHIYAKTRKLYCWMVFFTTRKLMLWAQNTKIALFPIQRQNCLSLRRWQSHCTLIPTSSQKSWIQFIFGHFNLGSEANSLCNINKWSLMLRLQEFLGQSTRVAWTILGSIKRNVFLLEELHSYSHYANMCLCHSGACSTRDCQDPERGSW